MHSCAGWPPRGADGWTAETVVLLSGGMPASDRVGGRPRYNDDDGRERAPPAPTSTSSMSTTASSNPSWPTARSDVDGPVDPSHVLSTGLGVWPASGGALLQDPINRRSRLRSSRKHSDYYLLGVQPIAGSRRQTALPARHVKKRGLTIRSRTQVVIPQRAADPNPRMDQRRLARFTRPARQLGLSVPIQDLTPSRVARACSKLRFRRPRPFRRTAAHASGRCRRCFDQASTSLPWT